MSYNGGWEASDIIMDNNQGPEEYQLQDDPSLPHKKQRLASPNHFAVANAYDNSNNAFANGLDHSFPPNLSGLGSAGPSTPTTAESKTSKDKEKDGKSRALRACDACRKNKSRCESIEGSEGVQCRRCKGRNQNCTFDLPATRRKTEAEKEANKRNRAAAAAAAAAAASAAQQNGSQAAFNTGVTVMPGPNGQHAYMDSALFAKLQAPQLAPELSGKQLATADQLKALASLRDAVAAEEAEAERLQLLVKYKTLQRNNEALRDQLSGLDGVTTPPHLKG